MAEFIYSLLNNLLFAIAWVFAKVATLLSSLVFWSAEFSDFTTLEQVSKAWIIIRDFSNMFFIIILLVIAFGTVINKEEYSYKKLLGKMVIAAVLVNFSKTICGLIIDASQVFLFTFLKATYKVKEVGLLEAFGLHDIMSVPEGTEPVFTNENVFYSLIMVVVLLAAACIVMLTYAVMFLIRVAMLWLLVVISPLPYVFNILPISQIQEFASKWWKMFGNYVVLGPMIGFFLWLALFIATYKGDTVTSSMAADADWTAPSTSDAALTKAASPEMVANFVVATLLLLGGLQMTTGLAAEFSEITGRTTNLGKSIVKFTGRRLDDAQNLTRSAAGWLTGKAGNLATAAGDRAGVNRFGRGLHLTGKALGAVGRTVGADFTLRPSEIGEAFKEITGAWDKQRMQGRRANLRQAMAGAMTPSRWAGNVIKKSLAGQASREKGNDNTVSGALDALGNNNIQDILTRHQNGEINDAERDNQIQEVINGLDIGNNRDNLRAQIGEAMDVLNERMRSNDYSAGERERMQQSIGDLGTLDGFLQVQNVGAAGAGISNFLTRQNDDSARAMNNFDSFGNNNRRMTGLAKGAYRVGDWVASKYAGEDDFATDYHQAQIAEAKKQLDAQTGGVSEQVVGKLEDAYKRGDTAKIVAALEQLWNSNDQNEIHNSKYLIAQARKEVERRARAAANADDTVADKDAAVSQATRHFDDNYTSQQYMGIFTQKMLERAYQGDTQAMARQHMRLDSISVERGGCSQYGGAMVDAETGEGTFNQPVFQMGPDGQFRARTSRAQIGAIMGKSANMSIDSRVKARHPQLMTARDVNGRQRGLTDAGREIIDASVAEEFMSPKSWRPDLINALNTDESMEDILGMTQEAGISNIARQKRSAFLAVMAGMHQGLFSDKNAGRFFQHYTSGNNQIDAGLLQELATATPARKKEIIEQLEAARA